MNGVCVVCQNVSGDGSSAARVDAVTRTDRAKATSDAGQWISRVCSTLNTHNRLKAFGPGQPG